MESLSRNNNQKFCKYLFLMIVFEVCSLLVQAQNDTVIVNENAIETAIQILEEASNESDESYDFNEDLQIVNLNERLNINNLTEVEAFSVLHLSDYQYYQLIKYIDEAGPLVSIYELVAVEGFNREIVMALLPYLDVRKVSEQKRYFDHFWTRARHKLLFRYAQVLEARAGYDTLRETHYEGTPQRYLFKYTCTSGENFSFGIAGEKDAGEQFFKGSQKRGFDFYSGHIQIKNISILKSLIIGDYKVNTGQGVALGCGISMRGMRADAIRQIKTRLSPTTAMNESNFFRGAAVALGNYKYSAVLFYSHRFCDGDVVDSLSEFSWGEGVISQSGMHRTIGELEKRSSVKIRVYGADFQYKSKLLSLGMRIVKTDFIPNFIYSSKPYQLFYHEGCNNLNGSIDYQFAYKKQIFFGEFGINIKGAPAILQCAVLKVNPRYYFSLMFRHYGKNYYAYFANAYSKNSRMNNETGLLLLNEIFVNQYVTLFASADYYRIHWLQYRVDKPSDHVDLSMRIDLNLNRQMSCNVQYKFKNNYLNRNGPFYSQVYEGYRHQVSAAVSYSPFPFLMLKSHFTTLFSIDGEKMRRGVLLFNDLIFNFQRINMSVIGRFALFDTDSYSECLRAYENDLSQTFTIASYYDKGIKGYLIFRYKYRFISCQCKISRIVFSEKNVIGSGLEQIEGNKKTEIRCQVGFSF